MHQISLANLKDTQLSYTSNGQDILKCFKQSTLSYHIFRWKLKTRDRLNKVMPVVVKEIRNDDDLQLCDRRD